MKEFKTLLVGRSRQDLESIEALLRKQSGVVVTTRLTTNGHTDPLYGITTMPDLLVLHLSSFWEEELNGLADRSPTLRPPIIVVSSSSDVQMMRKAMQAGVRDFFNFPIPEPEFAAAIQRIEKDRLAGAEGSRLTAVINAKGGSGATVLACNSAHVLATEVGLRVALVDMNVQFGTMPLYFDLKASQGLLKALDVVEDLDALALAGYAAKHESGVHLLGAMTERLVLPEEIPAQRLRLLLELLAQHYEQVIVDLPNYINTLTSLVMERADRIVIVMQQSLTHVRDAKRLMGVLQDELGIPDERITVVVNRYESKRQIGVADIEGSLGRKSLVFIPNDFKRVEDSVNLGVPLRDHAKNAPVTKAVMELAMLLSGRSKARKKGLFGRVFSLRT